MYWNFPQAASIGISLIGLFCFDLFCIKRGEKQGESRFLYLASLFFIIGGLIKPSLIIFLAPALLIWLGLNRCSLKDYFGVVLIILFGVIVYFLPLFMVDVPSHPSWNIHLSLKKSWETLRFALLGGGSLIILAIGSLTTLILNGKFSLKTTKDLLLIALGGSFLFALLFQEDRFVNFVVFQPNLWWGPSGCLILLFPFLIRETAKSNVGILKRTLHVFAFILVLIQILKGLLFAIVYPVMNVRSHPRLFAEVLSNARRRTHPNTRFLVDPFLDQIDIVSYLGRPVLYSTSMLSKEEKAFLIKWRRLCDKGFLEGKIRWDQYDAVIIYNKRIFRRTLKEKNWKFEQLVGGFELWLPP